MTYQTIEVRPLAGNIGAEIFGVDLSKDLNQQTFSEIHQAFLENIVIFFRDQDLTIEQQGAFTQHFGPLIHDPVIASPDGRPELMIVAREANEPYVFGDGWHTDSSYMEKPPLGSCLYAKEVPEYGGDTGFTNLYLAYETLSPGLRKTLDGLTAVHSPGPYNKSLMAGRFGEDRTMKLRHDDVMREALASTVEHPVIRTHPETGRKALYVCRAYVERFKDWTVEESKPLLEFLYQHQLRPEFSCRFRWRAGSLALWDNRCALHKPLADYKGRRIMHRIVAEGDRPH